MKRAIISIAAGLGLVLGAGAAQAATFDFRGEPVVADPVTFTADGVTVTVRAGTFSGVGLSPIDFSTRSVNVDSNGLGASGPGDTEGDIDGNEGFDILIISFSETVVLNEIGLTNLEDDQELLRFGNTIARPQGPITVTDTRAFFDSLRAVNGIVDLTVASLEQRTGTEFTFGTGRLLSDFRLASLNVTVPLSDAPVLAAAVLPTSRSVEVGQTATLFATVLNAGTTPAEDCTLSLANTIPASFSFQTTDPVTNAPIGTPDAAVDIAAGGAQTFVISVTPEAVQTTIDVGLDVSCTNATSPSTIVGVNTFSFSASDSPVPDVIALVATQTNNGIVELPDAATANVFTVASINLGVASTLFVSADSGGVSLPITVSLCETDPLTSACINPTAPTTGPISVNIANQATPTFGIFVTPSAEVPLDPATNRISVRFSEDGMPRGATSVAVQTLSDDP